MKKMKCSIGSADGSGGAHVCEVVAKPLAGQHGKLHESGKSHHTQTKRTVGTTTKRQRQSGN